MKLINEKDVEDKNKIKICCINIFWIFFGKKLEFGWKVFKTSGFRKGEELFRLGSVKRRVAYRKAI